MRVFLAALTAVSLISPAHAATPCLTPAELGTVEGQYTFEWPGSAHALPINAPDLPSSVLVQQALVMEGVQAAIDDFLARGYVRRPDLDYGLSLPTGAAAAIAFEKPGYALDTQQPVILVTSQHIGDFAATQIYGGVIASSDGTLENLRLDDSAENPAVDVTGQRFSDAGRAFETDDLSGVSLAYATHYDPVHTWGPDGSGWRYVSCRSTGISPSKWSGYGSALANGIHIGALNGMKKLPSNPQAWREFGFGLVVATYAAHTAYWSMNDSGC